MNNERTIEIFTNSPVKGINKRGAKLFPKHTAYPYSILPPPKKCVFVSDIEYRDYTENFCKTYLRFICSLKKNGGWGTQEKIL